MTRPLVDLAIQAGAARPGLDRKMRLGDQPLSPVEKDALDLADEVYAAHPLGTTGRERGNPSAVA